jgi:succinate dehydrogenase / fumarate reductase cytochrome b subunit
MPPSRDGRRTGPASSSTWAFFQHTLSGLRHFTLDIGAGYELDTNKKWSLVTLVGALILTAALWAYIVWGR